MCSFFRTFFFLSSRRRHTRWPHDWSSDVCSSDLHQESGFFCAGYKERCLRRRLAIRMRARGVHRYSEYGHLLRIDPVEYERSEEGRVGKESRIRRMTNE